MRTAPKVQRDSLRPEKRLRFFLPVLVSPVKDTDEVHVEDDAGKLRTDALTACRRERPSVQDAHGLVKEGVVLLFIVPVDDASACGVLV